MFVEEEVVVSVRGTGLVFGMGRGGRSHKALAYLLQVSGSHAGPKGLMERWQ